MSILFNNGSGGVNQTDGYIPYNDNGQFKDSPFYYNKLTPFLLSRNPLTNNDEGLYFDWNQQIFYFGDYNGNTKGFAFFIDNNSELIRTLTSGVDNGLRITNTQTFIGDYNNNFNGNSLKIEDNNNFIFTTLRNDAQGLKLYYDGLGSYEYWLGDFDGVHNNSYIAIFDSSQTIEMRAATQFYSYSNDFRVQTNNLNYAEITAGSLIYTTAGGSSGKHLKIFINGVGYKIALNNL